jgi:3,2-trans-enoyl-CoA isomerase
MLKLSDHGRVREIQIDRPPANALNPELVMQLRNELNEAATSADAVVVSGRSGMFSAGLDIPELLNLDHDGIKQFWKSFVDLLGTIAKMPIPTVFALTGHAPAGGIVLSMYADYRIMSGGKFKTGLNEVQVGLVVSPVIKNALARLIGPHQAERILVPGTIFSADHALQLGLVDELSEDPESTVTRAVEWCHHIVSLPRDAMLLTRELAREDLVGYFDDERDYHLETFADLWFSDLTQRTLNDMVARLKKK